MQRERRIRRRQRVEGEEEISCIKNSDKYTKIEMDIEKADSIVAFGMMESRSTAIIRSGIDSATSKRGQSLWWPCRTLMTLHIPIHPIQASTRTHTVQRRHRVSTFAIYILAANTFRNLFHVRILTAARVSTCPFFLCNGSVDRRIFV